MKLRMASSPAGTLESHVANQQEPKKNLNFASDLCPDYMLFISKQLSRIPSACAQILYLFKNDFSFTFYLSSSVHRYCDICSA